MSRPLMDADDAILWGVLHCQGIRWCDSEASSRSWMSEMVKSDNRLRIEARGKVRLVRRFLGPLEVVENPYEPEAGAR